MSDHSEINFWICNYLKCLAHQSHQDKEGIDGDTMVTKVHAEGVPSRNQRRCAEWSADAESSAILICSGRCVCVSRYFWLHSLLIVFSIFCLMFDVFLFYWKCICCPEQRFVDFVVLWEAEWASAMLTVGVCRAAAIESFEGFMPETVTLKLVKRRKQKKHILYHFISLYMNQSESWDRWRDQEDETRATFHFRHIAGALADLGEDLLTDLGRFRTMSVCDGWEIGNHFPSWYSTSPSTCKKTRRRHSTRANLFNFSIFEKPVPRDSRLSAGGWGGGCEVFGHGN